MTSIKEWEKKVLAAPGAVERVAQIEDELRLAAGLTALREQAGLSQRELAHRIGVRQPRIAAIERSRNVTVDVLERYVTALGGQLELSVIQDGKRYTLIGSRPKRAPTSRPKRAAAASPASKRQPTSKTTA